VKSVGFQQINSAGRQGLLVSRFRNVDASHGHQQAEYVSVGSLAATIRCCSAITSGICSRDIFLGR
jgi:hypothetical protein